MDKLQKDLTTGNVGKLLWKFTLPMLGANILQALYNVVDSLVVGNVVGEAGLSAVSISFPIILIVLALVIGMGLASTILIAQYSGAKQPDDVRSTIGTSLSLFLIAAVVLSIVGLFVARPLLELINAPPESIDPATEYLRIMFGGLVFVFGYNAISGIQRGLGDSITPLIFVLISTLMNVGLDILFVQTFGMGVPGAAWATIISQGVSFLLGIIYFRRKKHIMDFRLKSMRIAKDKLKLILKTGWPASAQQVLLSISFLFISSLVNEYGVSASAAFGVGNRFDNFNFMPATAINAGVAAISGQNIGAGLVDRARDALKQGLKFSLVFSIIMLAVNLLLAEQLVGFFNREADVVAIGAMYLRTVSFLYIPLAVMFTCNGLIQGAGNTLLPMISTILTIYVVRMPLAVFLSKTMGLGLQGICYALVAAPLLGMFISGGYVLSGRWKKRKLIQHGPVPGGDMV